MMGAKVGVSRASVMQVGGWRLEVEGRSQILRGPLS